MDRGFGLLSRLGGAVNAAECRASCSFWQFGSDASGTTLVFKSLCRDFASMN